jgi:hypothetical protein
VGFTETTIGTGPPEVLANACEMPSQELAGETARLKITPACAVIAERESLRKNLPSADLSDKSQTGRRDRRLRRSAGRHYQEVDNDLLR